MTEQELEQKRQAFSKLTSKWNHQQQEIQAMAAAVALLRALFSEGDEWTASDEAVSRVICSLDCAVNRKVERVAKLAKRKEKASEAYWTAYRENKAESEPTTTETND